MSSTKLASNSPQVQPTTPFALFDYGFRPFFLLAGWYAMLLVPAWLWVFTHVAPLPFTLPPMYWHAHEMLFGFVSAAIAGFLLTAVPSWTGVKGSGGSPLIALTLLWTGGRIAMASAGALPFWITAIVELSFLPALVLLLAPPLIRSRNRNTPLLAVLGMLWLLDTAFVVAIKKADVVLAAQATQLAIDMVMILVTVIGGRIVPAFTGNALRQRGAAATVISRPWLETTVIAAMIAIAVVDIARPTSTLSGILAGIAALAQVLRLSGWRSLHTRGDPILWVLHVGYAWLPMGLALKACWLLGGFDFAAKWQHALTMGVFATMILAVMTRASLGHTGRALVVSPAITAAYVLLTTGVLLRVFAPAAWPAAYVTMVFAAGACWTAAFLLYVIIYTPILVRPRVDGKQG